MDYKVCAIKNFTDSLSTTNWMLHHSGLSLVLFFRMNRAATSPCPAPSPTRPLLNVLEIEEALIVI